MIIRKPLTDKQKEKILAREKTSQEEINQAADSLFMFLMEKIETLEPQPLRARRRKE